MIRSHTLTEALAHGTGIERPFLCPAHGDSRPSASVNIVKKKWYCYTCGAHGGLSGPAMLVEPDYADMARRIEEQMEAAEREYTEAWLARYDAGPVHPYWIGRFDERTARRFRLGYDAGTDSATYPLRRPSGAVCGVVRRPLSSEVDGPKYLYPRGVDISKLLFNYPTCSGARVVVLVEGAMDAVALAMVGVHAFAIYGAQLSAAQIRLIDQLDPTHIYTCFDNDKAGWTAHARTEDTFRHRLVGRLEWPKVWGKDIDEIGLERRQSVVLPILKSGLGCVECETWTTTPKSSSMTTSTRAGLRILRTSA